MQKRLALTWHERQPWILIRCLDQHEVFSLVHATKRISADSLWITVFCLVNTKLRLPVSMRKSRLVTTRNDIPRAPKPQIAGLGSAGITERDYDSGHGGGLTVMDNAYS
jgi:hypothetical protein